MEIQTDLSDNALVTAIRANLCEFFRHISRSLPGEHYEDEKFTRWHTPLLHPWFNGVLSSQMPADGDEPFIRQTTEYFREKTVRAFTWWMEPHLQRSDWEPFLSRYGFHFSDDTPGMAADLQALNEPAHTVEGLEVRVVADEVSLRTWTHIFTLGYGLPNEWEDDIHALWWKLGLGYPLRNFIGYLNDKPVATSCLFSAQAWQGSTAYRPCLRRVAEGSVQRSPCGRYSTLVTWDSASACFNHPLWDTTFTKSLASNLCARSNVFLFR